jgi:hypothetical protein
LGFGLFDFNKRLLPKELAADAEATMKTALLNINKIHSTRSMAFIIKGLYYANTKSKSVENTTLIKELADRLLQMYRHETDQNGYGMKAILPMPTACYLKPCCAPGRYRQAVI